MECSRSERPMLTSEVGTDSAGRVKHDLYVGNMGSKCIQSHTPYPEFYNTGNFSRQQVMLGLLIVYHKKEMINN